MLDNKTYQRELIRMFDSIRKTHKWEKSCGGVDCRDCPLQVGKTKSGCDNPFNTVEIYNIVEKWSKEHPRPKYKVSQLEYDILHSEIEHSCTEVIFDDFSVLGDLVEEGYFEGATLETNVGDYFDNCQVVDK